MSRPLILPRLDRTWRDAERFSLVAHREQVDKDGKPYWTHLDRVANGTAAKMYAFGDKKRDEAMQIAWLHDVIEDTGYSPADLAREGFHQNVILGVLALSRNGRLGESYQDWIASICRSTTLEVILVKLSDVEDNSDPRRLAALEDKTRARLERKYHPALKVLRAAAEDRGWVPF